MTDIAELRRITRANLLAAEAARPKVDSQGKPLTTSVFTYDDMGRLIKAEAQGNA
ncbi:hypothetical protein J2X01_000723 [Arthrobacter ginsengisoli]|uniref:YD repeat-containing protein n=1 Tax=Arthrobacter ginsengisoli TaxID=1356565 RepID=A0ABU1U8F5_9MICC|nr:hypothetical protein [Arthrobacter ginsengisoli]MDR7081446.1 hypothetical protein [Arthrobacter ginsengisoli]